MKPITKKDEHDQLGMGGGKEFTIDTESSMIVSILRDKLYKNKVGAVCREVSSNCRDANREAGRADVPIVITIHEDSDLIGDGNTLISFKDSGIGITPDRIDNVFLKYGGSTKRDSNNQTGGFGIGAKTPFAYTNNFIITTVAEVKKKNIKYIYQAVIIADGQKESSQLILILEEETNEPTGTTITVPIGSDVSDFILSNRIQDFEWECVHATAMWEVKPTLIGFKRWRKEVLDARELKVVAKGKNWSIVEDPNGFLNASQCIIASVDGIPYSIDAYEINDRDMKQKLTNFFGYYSDNLVPVLHIKTGEVSLSASREDIEYIKENLVLLIERYDKMKEELKGQAKELLKNAKTTLEKSTIVNKIKGYGTSNNTELDKACETFKHVLGQLVDSLLTKEEEEKIPFRFSDIAKFHQFVEIYIDNTKHQSLMTNQHIDIEDLKDKPIYYRAQNSCSRRNKTISKDDFANDFKGAKKVILVIPRKTGNIYLTSEQTLEQKSILKTLLEESNFELKEYSEVEKMALPKSERNSVDKEFENSILVPIKVKSAYGCGWNSETVECGRGKGKKPTGKVLGEFTASKTIIFTVSSIVDLKSGSGFDLFKDKYKIPSYFEGVYNSFGSVLTMLMNNGYRIIAVSESKFKYFEKSNFKTDLVASFEAIIETKEFKAKIQDWLDYNASQEVDIDDYLSEFYLKHTSFLELGGISKEVLEVNRDRQKESQKYERSNSVYELERTFNSNTLESMAEKLGLKAKDFGITLTETDVDRAFKIIEKKYPLIHYLFKVLDDNGAWEFSDYNNVKFGKSGEDLFLDEALKMVDIALKEKKEKEKAKKTKTK